MLIANKYMNQLVIGTFGVKDAPVHNQIPPIPFLWEPDKAPQAEIDAYMNIVSMVMAQVTHVVTHWSDEHEACETDECANCANRDNCE